MRNRLFSILPDMGRMKAALWLIAGVAAYGISPACAGEGKSAAEEAVIESGAQRLMVSVDEDATIQQNKLTIPLTEEVRASALDSFIKYGEALKSRDFAAAYQMLRLSYQAANPRLEWEMGLRRRDGLWVDGALRLLRQSWYQNPKGQPEGLYAAFDFRGDRADGSMDCGYVVVHQALENSAFTIVRTDTNFVPEHLLKDAVPQADVLRQLPCFLGRGIATAL